MAGGRGERLAPLTDTLPKPLLDVGGKPIVEHTLERLMKLGIKNFTFCLNYKGEMVRDYFGNGENREVEIQYIEESEPFGTIGGVSLKTEFEYEDLLVINGDLLTNINFEQFYDFFVEEDADLAVATIPYQVNLPYGILTISDENEVESIKEKPSFTYHINTGIYFLKREIIDLIPKNQRFDAIDLIQTAMAKDYKVSSFPLLDYWVDIGQMEDYHKAQKDIKFLNL
jgi:NDP-sugar pyrophosphorylase family protein